MRAVIFLSALLIGLPAHAASPEAQAYVAVDECVLQTKAAAASTKARDFDGAVFNSQQARNLCTIAAGKLRRARFEGVDTRALASALESMVGALEHFESAVRLRHSDPAAGRREAEAGLALLQQGEAQRRAAFQKR